jgi:hypothetical protein
MDAGSWIILVGVPLLILVAAVVGYAAAGRERR